MPGTVQALLCTALLSALFFSWLWQAFRLYSYPGLVPYNDEAGELFHLPLLRGSHCLLTASGCGSVLRTKSRAKDTCSRSWEHAPTAQACDAAADVDAGCVDGYAGFQRIFRMGTLRQLGRQRSCRG